MLVAHFDETFIGLLCCPCTRRVLLPRYVSCALESSAHLVQANMLKGIAMLELRKGS